MTPGLRKVFLIACALLAAAQPCPRSFAAGGGGLEQTPENADLAEVARHRSNFSQAVERIDLLRADGPVSKFINEKHGVIVEPMVRRYKEIFAKPQAQRDLAGILTHRDRQAFLYVEAIWLLLVLAFYFWVRMKTKYGKKRTLWVRFWISTLYLCGAMGFVPELVFGPPYVRMSRAAVYIATGIWG